MPVYQKNQSKMMKKLQNYLKEKNSILVKQNPQQYLMKIVKQGKK